jgi:hypothetical protein
VNAEREKALVAEDEVSSLPALVLYHLGTRVQYAGQHTSSAVMQFVDKLLAPAYTPVGTEGDLVRTLATLRRNMGSQPHVLVRSAVPSPSPIPRRHVQLTHPRRP